MSKGSNKGIIKRKFFAALLHHDLYLNYIFAAGQRYFNFLKDLRLFQVVTLATYLFFIFTVIGRQKVPLEGGKEIMRSGRYPLDIDLYIPIFTMLQFFFYMGLLKVVHITINASAVFLSYPYRGIFGGKHTLFGTGLTMSQNVRYVQEIPSKFSLTI